MTDSEANKKVQATVRVDEDVKAKLVAEQERYMLARGKKPPSLGDLVARSWNFYSVFGSLLELPSIRAAMDELKPLSAPKVLILIDDLDRNVQLGGSHTGAPPTGETPKVGENGPDTPVPGKQAEPVTDEPGALINKAKDSIDRVARGLNASGKRPATRKKAVGEKGKGA